jgi:hypothetical protein
MPKRYKLVPVGSFMAIEGPGVPAGSLGFVDTAWSYQNTEATRQLLALSAAFDAGMVRALEVAEALERRGKNNE